MLQSELTNNPPRKQSKKQRWECLRRSHLLLRLLFSSLPQSGCLSKITCSQTVLSSERLPCIRHFLLRVVSWDGCICRLSPETECGMVGSGRRTTPADVALFCVLARLMSCKILGAISVAAPAGQGTRREKSRFSRRKQRTRRGNADLAGGSKAHGEEMQI